MQILSIMPIAKVAVLYNKSLFAAGIECRLQDAKAFEVVRVDGTREGLIEEMREIGPDVIILDATAGDFWITLAVAEILTRVGSSKVIKLGLNSEEMVIYRSERQPLVTGEDLVAAIGHLTLEREFGEEGGECMQGD